MTSTRGLRIPVARVVRMLRNDGDEDPHIREALRYEAEALRERELPLPGI